MGESGAKKGQGQVYFLRYFLEKVVFLNSPHREVLKNVMNKIQNQQKIGFGFFSVIL
jgi:hypothetical protein